MTMFINLLAAAQGTGGFDISFLIMIIAIFAIMYFFMIRPQQKRQKEIQKFRNSLAVGSQVVTYGGVHGTIRTIDEAKGTVKLEVAQGVTIEVEKSHLFANGQATNGQR